MAQSFTLSGQAPPTPIWGGQPTNKLSSSIFIKYANFQIQTTRPWPERPTLPPPQSYPPFPPPNPHGCSPSPLRYAPRTHGLGSPPGRALRFLYVIAQLAPMGTLIRVALCVRFVGVVCLMLLWVLFVCCCCGSVALGAFV